MDSLYLPSSSTPQVNVHPLVMFSLLNHHARREQGTRVIGALLGSVDKQTGTVEVTDAFGVFHTVKEDEVRLKRWRAAPAHPSTLTKTTHAPPAPLAPSRRSWCASRRCRTCTSSTGA